MTVVWASRKVRKTGIVVRYDAGTYSIEADDKALIVAAEAMDQLVEEWPKIRADVAGRKK